VANRRSGPRAISGPALTATGPAVLAPDVTRIPLPTPFAVGDVNAYLVTGARTTLVDSGPAFSEAEAALERALATKGLVIEDIEVLLLTHQHHDHVGLAHRIRARAGAEVIAGHPLSQYLGDFDGAMERDDGYSVAMMLRHGVDPRVAETLQRTSQAMRRFGHDAMVDTVVSDGDVVHAGDRTLSVAARPGHSPTDTIYIDAGGEIAFAGDHLLERISSNPFAHCPVDAADGPQAARATPLPAQLAAYRDSLTRTRTIDITTVLPGHGRPFTGHQALIDEREAMHIRRADEILGALHIRPADASTLSEQLWPELPVTQVYLALSEVLGHLHLLHASGRVTCDLDAPIIRFSRVS
jgi:glyoxylase-like metal-dependent hydrolase (beta-lactamase superfamily II)